MTKKKYMSVLLYGVIGVCNGGAYWPPKCVECVQSMGDSCQYDCLHGRERVPFSSNCTCDPCYTGFSCDVECTHAGMCTSDNDGNMVGRQAILALYKTSCGICESRSLFRSEKSFLIFYDQNYLLFA